MFLVAGIWAVVAVLSAVVMATLDLTAAGYPLVVGILLAAYYSLLGLRGCTEFTDEGVHNTILRTATIHWDEIDRLQVVRGSGGAWLQVVADRRRVRLAAPRTGLIARDPDFAAHLKELQEGHRLTETRVPGWLSGIGVAAAVALLVAAVAVLDRPWLSDWWPGVPAATTTPEPCGVLDAPTLDRALTEHHDAGAPTSAFFGTGCEWKRLGDLDWDLVVSYDRFGRTAKATAADTAAEALTLFANHDGRRPVPGIGDETYTWTSGAITTVLSRKANVIVEVEYNGDPATAIDLARTATTAVESD